MKNPNIDGIIELLKAKDIESNLLGLSLALEELPEEKLNSLYLNTGDLSYSLKDFIIWLQNIDFQATGCLGRVLFTESIYGIIRYLKYYCNN